MDQLDLPSTYRYIYSFFNQGYLIVAENLNNFLLNCLKFEESILSSFDFLLFSKFMKKIDDDSVITLWISFLYQAIQTNSKYISKLQLEIFFDCIDIALNDRSFGLNQFIIAVLSEFCFKIDDYYLDLLIFNSRIVELFFINLNQYEYVKGFLQCLIRFYERILSTSQNLCSFTALIQQENVIEIIDNFIDNTDNDENLGMFRMILEYSKRIC